MSTGFIGHGTIIEWTAIGGDFASPEGTLPQTQGFTGVGPTAERVEITNDTSLAGRREYIAGLIDSGQATIPIVVPKPAGDTLVSLWALIGVTKLWRVSMPDGDSPTTPGNGTTLVFPGQLLECPIDSETARETRMNAVLSVSGDITVTPYVAAG